jgi:hypothetical protein
MQGSTQETGASSPSTSFLIHLFRKEFPGLLAELRNGTDFGGAQEWILEQVRSGMDFGGAQEWILEQLRNGLWWSSRMGFWCGVKEWILGILGWSSGMGFWWSSLSNSEATLLEVVVVIQVKWCTMAQMAYNAE